MSRRKNGVPSYGLHQASGQARTVINGKTPYLGKHDSPECREKYARLITKLAAQPAAGSKQAVMFAGAPTDGLTIDELIV